MIPFRPITLEDREWIDRLLRQEDSRSADHSFANIYLWDETYAQQAAEVCGCLIIRLDYLDTPFFASPAGGGDWLGAMEAMKQDAESLGVPLQVRGVTQRHLEALERHFPGQYELTSDRYVYDYVYEAEKLATLSGKKLHGKRNHINRFLEDHPDWSFAPLTRADFPACEAFQQEWLAMNADGDTTGLDGEKKAIRRAFDHFEELGLEGGVLRLADRIIGYTIGEKLCSDTYVIHFEKAHADIQGSYPMLNREFVRLIQQNHPEIQYINREDDMGHENLRKAKESYYPAFLVEKHSALWK
jgi:hypothetical protein